MLLTPYFVANQPQILTNSLLQTTASTAMGANVKQDTATPQSSPPELRKIFLGGLRYTETEDTIKQHFEKFGLVESVLLPKEKGTGKPRGFGFVTFRDEGIAQSLAEKESHVFNGRLLDIKLAVPRNDPPPSEESPNTDMEPRTSGANPFPGLVQFETSTAHEQPEEREIRSQSSGDEDEKFLSNRIFVGGLPDGVTNSVLREYFSRFGTVLDSFVLLHAATKRPRGFGFVTFKEEEVVPQVISYPDHLILGKKVETRLATTRSEKPHPTSTPNEPQSISMDSPGRPSAFNGNPMMKPRAINRTFPLQQNHPHMHPNQMMGMMQMPYNQNNLSAQAQAMFYYARAHGMNPINMNQNFLMKQQQQFYPQPGATSINYTGATFDPNATPYYSFSGVSTFVGGQMPMNMEMQQPQMTMHQHSNSSSSNDSSPPGSTAHMGGYFDQS